MANVYLDAGWDTHINRDRPNQNYGAHKRLELQKDSRFAYVYFPQPLPLGSTIISATLRLWSEAVGPGDKTITVQRTVNRRALSNLKWTNRPPADWLYPGILSTTETGPLPDKHVWEIDVTSHLQAIVDGDRWTGWELRTDSPEIIKLYSANTSPRPTLEIEWVEAPDAPQDLVPSGGLAAGYDKTTLRFSYVDNWGDTTLAAVHVQIDPNGDWANPLWDSGETPATAPELDLERAGFPGMVNGSSVKWRARVQDGAGFWSDWSETAEFRYVYRGDIEIHSPVQGTFSDVDPTFSWTYTGGGNQTAYICMVLKLVDGEQQVVYNSTTQRSTETTHTPSRPIKFEDGQAYRFYVRVYDDVDRVAVPRAVPWAWAYVYDNVFEPDAAIPGATNVQATANSPHPDVTLKWRYESSYPDEWAVMRNGELVERIPFDDPRKIGTDTFEWVDRTAPGHTPLTYEVRAVIGGRMSTGNPSAAITTRPFGLWLLTESGEDIVLADVDEGSWGMGEQSTVHEVLGGDRVTVTTQSLRGYEGTVSGLLVDGIPGVSAGAREMRERAFRVKENPGQNLRLVAGDLNIPVTVANIEPKPMPYEEIIYSLSFRFWQVGELPFEAP